MSRQSGSPVETLEPTWRISAVAQKTGLSKELIHHYLRQGLLPAPSSRATYTSEHIRLLRIIRTLREDHNLPLDVIRRVFTLFGFDATRIESLTFSESLCNRLTRFVDESAFLANGSWTTDEVIESTGVSAERLAECVRGGLVAPLLDKGEARFSAYDRNIVALCDRGLGLGIPFESFATIASYIRVGFELEHAEFFAARRAMEIDSEAILNMFVRREVANSFIQNVLSALFQHRLRQDSEAVPCERTTLEDVVYQPSAVFIVRHGLEGHIDDARTAISAQPDDPERWRHAAHLLLHVGRYSEAAFILDQSLRRWPFDHGFRGANGRALVLLGEYEHGREQLAMVDSDTPHAAQALVYAALARFKQACIDERPEAILWEAAAIREAVDQALEAARTEPRTALEVTILGGWLLTALPLVDCVEQGRALLVNAFAEAERADFAPGPLPGWAERQHINAAYLLFECLGKSGPEMTARAISDEPEEAHANTTPSRTSLRHTICALDPASSFAKSAFLTEGPISQRVTRPE